MDTTANARETNSGKRRRLHQALSARAVEAAKAPGRTFDGNGLFLLVTERGPNVSKVWKQRITFHGRRHELGLGGYPVVTLAKAREKALANLRMVDDGLNPKVERRRAKGIPTFERLARADFEHRKAGWRNAKHALQWIRTLEEFAFPRLGERTVDDITTDDVFGVLSPIWHTKPTTAKRLRQRIAGGALGSGGERLTEAADIILARLRECGDSTYPAVLVNLVWDRLRGKLGKRSDRIITYAFMRAGCIALDGRMSIASGTGRADGKGGGDDAATLIARAFEDASDFPVTSDTVARAGVKYRHDREFLPDSEKSRP